MVYNYYKGVVKERMSKITLLAIALLFGLTVAIGVHKPVKASTTRTIVSRDTSIGENQPGWLFNRDSSTSTPFEFNHNASSTGRGSLYVLPIGANAADKFIAENFINALISDTERISYDFLIGNGGDSSDKNKFYMNVYANFGISDDDKYYDCRYNVVPSIGSNSEFKTVTFDPTQDYPVTTRGGASASPFTCPASPADMDNFSSGSNIRAFSINVGDTSANDIGLDGYIDKVETNISGSSIVYDFEPSPTNKDDCKKDGWKDFGFKNQGQCIQYVNTGRDSR